MLRPLNSRSLTDQVFDQLAAEIMAERYPAGSSLPSERALTEIFKVNRQVVREALTRLAQLSLVKIAHGDATKVLDFKKHARLDLLALMAEHATASGNSEPYQLAVLEMRAALGTDIVRLCAKRADDEVRRDLVTLSEQMRAAPNPQDLFALEVKFWGRLLDGAGNIAYRLAVNTLVDGAYVMGELALAWFVEEIRASDYRMPIARAVASGDPDRAERVARKILRPPVETYEAMTTPTKASSTTSARKRAARRPVVRKRKG